MSKARVEIINDEEKVRNFEELEVGTVFEFEGHIFLKLACGWEAVLLSDEHLGLVTEFNYDDSVIVYDHAMITVKTRVE